MNIEIFSDLVCPWCYIGKRRLDEALASGLSGLREPLQVIWRAFQLYPGIPQAGMSRAEFNRLRYGGGAARGQARERLESEARSAGIDLAFDRITRMPNTFNGHRLLAWSRRFDAQHGLAERLFDAYFVRGLDLGDEEVLLAKAEESGLDAEAAREMLRGDALEHEVRAELDRAANVGITSVPCFLLGGRFALPGAQEAAAIRQVIERADARVAAETG